MLLQRLKEFADANTSDPAPRLYSRRPIRYIIDLDEDGRLLNPEMVDTSESKDELRRKGTVRLAPFLSRSKDIRPLLLADNAHYTLGLSSESLRPERPGAMHDSYLALVDRCGQATASPPVQAIHRFLDAGAPGLSLPKDFNSRDSITFRIGGEFPIDFPDVRKYWASEAATTTTRELQCLVCGEIGPVLDHLPSKLKAIPGGHATGSSFSSANRPAFESYGLKSTQNAPMCPDCGERVTGAANDLILDGSSSISFTSTKTIIWTSEEPSVDWASILASSDRTAVQAQIRGLSSGLHRPGAQDTPLYCATFSGSGGRAAMRDWFETTVGLAEQNLREWFMSHDAVDAWHEEGRTLSIHSLAGATARNLSDVSASVVTSLIRCALLGDQFPAQLLHLAVSRNRTERRVTRPRAALISMALQATSESTRPYSHLADMSVSDHNPAYLCGRLLAVLESTELASTRTDRASITDRYFSIASTAPAAAFNRLHLKGRQNLNNVRRHSVSAHRALESATEEIQDILTDFPTVLNLEEQGLFGLGYYHQRVRLLRRMRGLPGEPGPSRLVPSRLDAGCF